MSIATKLDRIVTYLEGLLGTKSSDPYNTWPCKITWKDGKLDRMLFYLEELLAKVTWPFDHVLLQNDVTS